MTTRIALKPSDSGSSPTKSIAISSKMRSPIGICTNFVCLLCLSALLFYTSRILPSILPHHLTTYHIYSSVWLALEFGIFPCMLPLDCDGADAVLPTCVPTGLPRDGSSFPMWPYQSLLIPHLTYPLLLQCYYSWGPATVFHGKVYIHSRVLFLWTSR